MDIPVSIEEIAYYIHCQAGVSPKVFLVILNDELEHLDQIDPFCLK